MRPVKTAVSAQESEIARCDQFFEIILPEPGYNRLFTRFDAP
jgi:hypothetical protein